MITSYINHSKKIVALLFLIMQCMISSAQTNGNMSEVILRMEHFSYEKQYDDVRQKLYNFTAVNIAGYCKSLDVLMLTIDRSKQPEDSKMFDALKTAGYYFVVKEDATIAKVQAACSDKKNKNTENVKDNQ